MNKKHHSKHIVSTNDEPWDVEFETLLTPGVNCVEYECKDCHAKHRVLTHYPAFIQAQFKDYIYTCPECRVKYELKSRPEQVHHYA